MAASALSLEQWLKQHPGSTAQDYAQEQAAEQSFSQASGLPVGFGTQVQPIAFGPTPSLLGGPTEPPEQETGGGFGGEGPGPVPSPMPPINVGGGFSGPGGSTTTAGNVTVIVNDINNTTQAVIQQIASAVRDGITAGTRSAVDVVNAAFGSLKDTLKSIADTIWNGIKAGIEALATNIWNIIKGVASDIGNIVKAIIGPLGDLIVKIKDELVVIIDKIAPVLDAITKEVQHINDTLIQPIATFINTTVKTIADLTTAIERDLHEGLSGIIQIPGQIATGLSSLDASLTRTVEQLGQTNKEIATSTVDYEGSTLPPKYAAANASVLVGKTSKDKIASTFSESLTLNPETLQQVSSEAISALGPLLKEVLEIIWNICKSPFDQQHADWSAVENVFVGLLDGILGILTTLTAVGALVEPLLEAASEEARTRVPVTKLDVNSIVSALRRGFLSESGSSVELSKLGFDATRIQVLKDLSITLVDTQTAIDWWYRGLIPDDDLANNLTQHGIIQRDIDLFKQGSIRLPSIDEVSRWRHFGIIDDDAASIILKALRYDDAQIQAYIGTEQTRETAAGRAAIDGRLNAAEAGWLNKSFTLTTPDAVTLAGAREGLHPETTRLAWLAHWNLPSVQQAIQTYFRGLRTLTELQYAMMAANVPSEVWDELIQINRPLIPFRSIPTYVKAGYMTQADAEQELAAHGFDLHHINIILKAINPTGSTKAATTAQKIATLSESNARTLFDEGVLTQQQYTNILLAHGYSQELANAQVQVDLINAHTKQRKTALADLQAEVETSAISIDDAVSQLTAQGFTSGEIARFQRTVQKSLKQLARHPSISELDKFLKAGAITLDQYKSELQAQGWLDPWLTAFLALVTPPQPQPVSGT